ncbi:Tyrosine recombinase XerD [Paraburkholderia nemoris]|uniref:Tyrosine recombinase XerD n=1 Tax=Paraburkholderia nemoris TaxID=2793076 RepID=A0ABN7MWK8_9BURK|nr:Tyrosine recombinase XerD [Paraburkholderia nemoris]CAE6836648.1 Tyrosine recombinase XerD [Paraburkholderia nemoris]CAE6887175.1 Tyrosine recombinase XerD [Paraburkholderia domus]CAE6971350.1 Tyrosine recombinase XerD [Paraburkholderia nemoris]
MSATALSHCASSSVPDSECASRVDRCASGNGGHPLAPLWTRLAELTNFNSGFTEGEWLLVRAIADGLEWSYDWTEPAAQRVRFMLDFSYATGLRVSELVGATLGDVRTDEHGDHWLHLVGKGSRPGKVALPPLARTALDQYLVQRRLPVTPARWDPKTPLVANLVERNNFVTGDCPLGQGVSLRVDTFTSFRSEEKLSLCISAH